MSTEHISFRLDVLQGTRILVVDDVEAERLLLASYLREQGCRVYLASDGQDCLRKVRLIRPDLVLMDVQMPVCDGLSACRIMQADPEMRDIAVIFLTGAAMPMQRVQGLLAGAVDYVSKPFDFEEVRLRLAIHLRARVTAGAASEEEAPEYPADGASNLDNILFQSARMHLLRSLADTPDLQQLAGRVSTNSKRLNEAFRKCVGVTVFEYLREERMKQACILLRETSLAVQAIGLTVGYTSGANFATAFKERFGVSPRKFRQTRLAGSLGECV
ncbi:response regulator transcription factor [Stutzerimonas stutzeri]|uniref:response regulator transcription factor n=1 Tax=Stutzerimonas stutzeri TaxID=316 RepID=UPI0015E42002|nr:response regulator [Stutzerimonas stutzeri]MBA1261352.1 response regulator transcription factor [Stutzerimonas stutzeri]